MPQEHRAESAIAIAPPATTSKVLAFLGTIKAGADHAVSVGMNTTGAEMQGGIEIGLCVAIDNPEAVRPLLAAIDELRRRELGQERNDPDQLSENDARAEIAQAFADLALGRPATLAGLEIGLDAKEANSW